MNFTQGGETLFEANDWYWFTTGFMTGAKRGVATMQENWRFSDPLQDFNEVIGLISQGIQPQVFVFRFVFLL